jgi:hypothetical protein
VGGAIALASFRSVKPDYLIAALCVVAACYRNAPPTSAGSGADSITLEMPKIHVGQRWSEIASYVFDFEAIGGGERWPGSFTRTSNRTVEILEIENGTESRSRHTYLVDHERKTLRHDGPRDEEAATTALHGKTYVLATGTPTRVTADDGTAVPEEEATLVREREPRFGRLDPLQKAWLGRVLIKDKPYAATAAELASYREPGDDTKLTKYVVTYRGRRGKRVELDVTVAFTEGDAMKAELGGKYIVDGDTGIDLEFDISGPVTYRRDGGMLRGRMRITQHRTL